MMNRLLQKFRRDLLGLVFLATGLFIGLALFSFNPQDPSLNSIGHGLKVANWCGMVGSFLSDGLLQMWGVSAWLIVPGAIRMSWLAFHGEDLSLKNLKLIWGLLLLLTFSTLSATYFSGVKLYQDQISVGGILGMSLNRGLVHAFNPVGVQVILWFAAVVLVIFFSEKNLKELTRWPLLALKAVWAYHWAGLFTHLWQGDPSAEKAEKKARKAAIAAEKEATRLAAKEAKEAKAAAKLKPVTGSGLSIAQTPAPLIAQRSPLIQTELPLEEEEESPVHLPEKRRVVMKTRVPQSVENWELPKLGLVDDPPASRVKVDEKEVKEKARTLTEKLAIFDVLGEVVAAKPGPAVTMFEFRPESSVKISKITELEDDLSMALASESLRILAPIPGRDLVGIETSNKQRETVYMKDMLAEEKFWSQDITLPLALGRKVDGAP